MGQCPCRISRRKLKAAILESQAIKAPKVWNPDKEGPLNVKDRAYNRLCWEVDRRKPDWRMRSASDEGEAMKNSPE